MTKKEKEVLQSTCLLALARWRETFEANMDDEEIVYYEGAYKVTRYLCQSFGVPYPTAISNEEDYQE